MPYGIEMLNQAPIGSTIKVGLDEFISIFRSKGTEGGRWSRSYLETTRGMLATKEDIRSNKYGNSYYFQFNPQPVVDTKSTVYEERPYSGLPYIDYIWAGGGRRSVSFELFMDNTPQTKNNQFSRDWEQYAQEIHPRQPFSASGFTTIANLAYSRTRLNERGILPEVEFIQSFLYPALKENETAPKFAEGGIVATQQFRPPSIACLALGPIYLEGVIQAADVSYSLFDKDLTPLRAKISIELLVYEFYKPTKLW